MGLAASNHSYTVDFDQVNVLSDDKLWSELYNVKFTYNDNEECVAKTVIPFDNNYKSGTFKFTDASPKLMSTFWNLPEGKIPQYSLIIKANGDNVTAEFGGGSNMGGYNPEEIKFEAETDFNGQTITTFDYLLNRPFVDYGLDKISLSNFPYYLLTLTVQNTINVNGWASLDSVSWKEENGFKSIDLLVFSSKNAIAFKETPYEILDNILIIYEKDKQMIDAVAVGGTLKDAKFTVNQKLETEVFVNSDWNNKWKDSYFKDYLEINNTTPFIKDIKTRTVEEDGGLLDWITEQNEKLNSITVKKKYNEFMNGSLNKYLEWLSNEEKVNVCSGAFLIKDDPTIVHYEDFRIFLHRAVNYELNGGPFDLNTDSPTLMLNVNGVNVIIGAIYN